MKIMEENDTMQYSRLFGPKLLGTLKTLKTAESLTAEADNISQIGDRMSKFCRIFEYKDLTFKATLSQIQKEESPIWLFPGEAGLFVDFLVEVVDSQTGTCDPKYYKVRNVVHLSFSEETLEKCIETFKQSYDYMDLEIPIPSDLAEVV